MLHRYFYLVLLLIIVSFGAKAQGGFCPDNLDFERGDFTNWTCKNALMDAAGVYTWTIGAPIPNRHEIITTPGGTDAYGFFPELCPSGGNYSVKLGNVNSPPGRQATAVSYTYTIPATSTNFSIMFHYAIVLYDPPTNHSSVQRPRFKARITDLTTNTPVPCVDFDFISSASLPGFRSSPVNPSVVYKDWTPVSINLSGLAGRTIELEFTSLDCTLGGHFGYAYIDVSPLCNGVISGNTICIGDPSITMTAPFGFQTYEWYSDNTFSTILSTTQTLTLAPPPTVGSIFPVVVTPYPTFGCKDTLYAVIDIAPKPLSNAGPDRSVCVNQQIQIGGPGTSGYTYSWTPAAQVSNPSIPDPFAFLSTAVPTEFIVRTTDVLTGCFSYDTTIISASIVDTALTVNGKPEYCLGDPQAGSLSVSNVVAPIQWFDANGPIPGATGITYQPTVNGVYWAEVTQFGCLDSTRSVSFLLHELPVAGFTPTLDTGCVTSNSRLYTNTSTSADGAMTYEWRFSDGDIQQTLDVTKTFTSLGAYSIELVTTTQYGCKDSTTGVVNIFPNGIPDFIWDSICVNRPMLFTNLSEENASPQVDYVWTFNNGGPGSTLKDPAPVTYTTPGKVDVTLQLTAIGCANDPKSITKKVLVNAAEPGIRYPDLTVPLGSSKFIHVRDSVGSLYSWRPQIQLSSYDKQYTEFFSTSDDVRYFIDITDEHTCVTTDTMQMLVLKKPGFYLPSGFTPNGDGLNDDIKPYIVGMKAFKSFTVFNRWGNLVFRSVRYGEPWNGQASGKDQAAGVYVWILEYVTNDDKTVTEKGVLTLIR
jgi:gliding motility-associated-like protein